MDLPLALEQLTKTGRILPTDDWGSCAQTGTPYEEFAKNWRGKSPVPTEQELENAFEIVRVDLEEKQTQKDTDSRDQLSFQERVHAEISEIDVDRVALPGVTNNQLKLIIDRMLSRQRKILKYLER